MLDPEHVVESRNIPGGTAREAVLETLAEKKRRSLKLFVGLPPLIDNDEIGLEEIPVIVMRGFFLFVQFNLFQMKLWENKDQML